MESDEKVIIETSLFTLYFSLVLSQFLHGNRVRPEDAESKLRRDKFPLFDVNMAGISMGEYPRCDDTRDSPLGWKMPVG